MTIAIVSADTALAFKRTSLPKIQKAGREAKPLPETFVTLAESLDEGEYVPVVMGHAYTGSASGDSEITAAVAAWNKAARRQNLGGILFVRRVEESDDGKVLNVYMGRDSQELQAREERIAERTVTETPDEETPEAE